MAVAEKDSLKVRLTGENLKAVGKTAALVLLGMLGGQMGRDIWPGPAKADDVQDVRAELRTELRNIQARLTSIEANVQNMSYSMCEMKNDRLQDQGKAPRLCTLPN